MDAERAGNLPDREAGTGNPGGEGVLFAHNPDVAGAATNSNPQLFLLPYRLHRFIGAQGTLACERNRVVNKTPRLTDADRRALAAGTEAVAARAAAANAIGRDVRRLRVGAGLAQQTVADLFGWGRDALSKLETGKTTFTCGIICGWSISYAKRRRNTQRWRSTPCSRPRNVGAESGAPKINRCGV